VEPKKRIGQILLSKQLIDKNQLQSALGRQKQFGGRLASQCLILGFLSEEELLESLSQQVGCPAIILKESVFYLDNFKTFPKKITQQYSVVPFKVDDEFIHLAMVDPHKLNIIDDLSFVSGKKICPYIALQISLKDTIESAFFKMQTGDDEYFIGSESSRDEDKRECSLKIIPLSQNIKEEIKVSKTPSSMAISVKELEYDTPGLAGEKDIEKPDGLKVGQKRTKPTILVVDDDNDIRNILRLKLETSNFHVTEAATGHAGLEEVSKQIPDLIVLDAMLPGLHGFDVCQRLKNSKQYGYIPIIMITAAYKGWRYEQDIKSVYKADSFLEKPFNPQLLLQKIRELINDSEKIEGEKDVLGEDIYQKREQCFKQGLYHYQNQNFETAIGLFKKGLDCDPFANKFHFYLASAYIRLNDSYGAIAELEKTIELAPDHFSALNNLALLYEKMGFKKKSFEMWERALGVCSDHEIKTKIKEKLIRQL